ncbi:hypothetical protein SAMN05216378_5585 [Paenibacillus catalpae]|uniref:Uncharacterized protein n=1 Tax=Paenibacillus catalpae TaxID=1045775 RepID=A0A1I2H2T0_9BACL|nr:hypothetical protein [Paenibacillus catalpae]SFF23001.1 hypothetical protein SAMN05216378_5585 [Paenibacillus catalpae]
MKPSAKAGYSRAAFFVVMVSVIYAVIGNTFFQLAYRYSAAIDEAYIVFAVTSAVYALPVIVWFRRRYWYFALFIPVIWVPMLVVTGYLMGLLFPLPEDDLGGGMLLLFVHGLNLGAVIIGVALGLTVNAAIAAWRKFSRD